MACPTPPLFDDARIRGPEGILAFVPRRLADEDGRVGLEDMLVITGARALEGELITAMTGPVIPGPEWFPERWTPNSNWFPTAVFGSEDDIEATRVIAFRDEEWGVNDPLFLRTWTPGDNPLLDSAWWEPIEVVEAGDSLEELAADGVLLFGAAGHNFFPQDTYERVQDNLMPWEELADAETATVLEL